MIQIQTCKVCEAFLPMGANPIVQAHPKSRIVIIGQAPGIKAHNSKKPWNDASGDQLREWLHVSKEQFYNPELFALIPMGFCYPGKGISGDLPPRKECAPLWHTLLHEYLKEVSMTVLIGQYAQNYYIKNNKQKNLTENVRHFYDYLPEYFPLPHPSPRNFIWMNKNRWFTEEILPELKNRVQIVL